MMRFRQLDKIVEFLPGNSLTAVRTVSDREGFFQDHFPRFPVLPGVLMLESMFQACQWLVRATDDFAHSVVLLREARNVKFTGLVQPGQTLTVTAALKKMDSCTATLSADVSVGASSVASGKLVVERFNLAERYPARAETDDSLREEMRCEYEILLPQAPVVTLCRPSQYRWMWIDRFLEFVVGERAAAVKNVTMTDEPLDLYHPGFPVMPCSLILEGIAQTGGILVGACHNFQKRMVLAKISKSVFRRPAVPGDSMVYTAEILDLQPEGALIHGASQIGSEPHADVECFFAYLDDSYVSTELIGAKDVLAMLRLYRLFEVATTKDGRPMNALATTLESAT